MDNEDSRNIFKEDEKELTEEFKQLKEEEKASEGLKDVENEIEKKQLVKVYDVAKTREKDYWIYLSKKVSDLKKRIYKKGFRVKVESQKLWY